VNSITLQVSHAVPTHAYMCEIWLDRLGQLRASGAAAVSAVTHTAL
jgi:hypothetical protein